jgi:hypothetical protein
VVQRGGGLRLAAEAGLEYLVSGQVCAQRLDRDDPVQADVAGSVHLRHAAAANHAVELIAAAEKTGLCHVSHSAKPPCVIANCYDVGVGDELEALAEADAEDDEEALADVELLADELALVDDGEIFGDDVGFVDLLGFGLTEVVATFDGCSTVLGVGLIVTA